MEPEISPRCPACGAAIRARAAYCPQCGAAIKKAASETPRPANEPSEAPRRTKSDRDVRTTALPPVSSIVETPPKPSQDPIDTTVGEAKGGNSARPARRDAREKKKPSQRNRVAQAARVAVGENMRPRVEKLRQASNVVMEEVSAIDPSLRFILIALVLFVLFIVLLLLSFIR